MDGRKRLRRMAGAGLLATATVLATGCDEPPAAVPEIEHRSEPTRVVDDAGRTIALDGPARRIVSLVPSVTETIVALGAADRLVARTRYDRDPALAQLPSLGGGLDPSIEGIVALEPDLVVAWNARDDRALVPRLRDAGIPVYSAEIQDTTVIYGTIERMGVLLGETGRADSVAGALRDTLREIALEVLPPPRPRALYLIAGDPPRTAGPATFIGQALSIAGADPAFPEIADDWPTISLEAVVARDPDVIVLPVGEGIPGLEALEREPGWRDLPAIRAGRVVEIDADLLARPGPALGRAARVLRQGLLDVGGGI